MTSTDVQIPGYVAGTTGVRDEAGEKVQIILEVEADLQEGS